MIQYNLYIGEAVYLLAIAVWAKKRRYPLSWFFLAAICGLYVQLLLAEAVFPLIWPGDSFFRLSPDSFSLDFARTYSARQAAENFIMTLPLGAVLSFLLNMGKRRRLIATVMMAASVELVQLACQLLQIGFHSFDVKDVILNAAGGLAGYGLFQIFCRLVNRLSLRLSLRPYDGRGFFPLLVQTARNCAAGRKSLEGIAGNNKKIARK